MGFEGQAHNVSEGKELYKEPGQGHSDYILAKKKKEHGYMATFFLVLDLD